MDDVKKMTATGRFRADRPNPSNDPKSSELVLDEAADFGEIEMRAVAELLGEDAAHVQSVEDVIDRLAPNASSEKVMVGRRTEIEQLLSSVPTEVLQQIDRWRKMPAHNRAARRKKNHIGRSLSKKLPKGVSIFEAAAVV